MPPPAVDSSFDVAFWFLDRAQDNNEYMQPQKLHRLMFLAQAYFAVAYNGRKLMPAVFLADELGPIEPNVYRACAIQRPSLEPKMMADAVSHFLESIWRRFGPHSAEFLNKQVLSHAPYADALAKGKRTEISMDSMIEYYGKKATASPEMANTPPISQVLRPRLMRSQTGKPVEVQKWMPKSGK